MSVSRLSKEWTRGLLAIQLLTIFPIRISRPITDEDLGASLRYYPIAGLGMGALVAAMSRLLLRSLNPMASTTLALVLLVVFSGALHWDGLADMLDGFYAGKNKGEVLAIMKDHHSGAMAIVGIVCLFCTKLSLLWSVPLSRLMKTLVLMPAVGRWTMVLVASLSPYARTECGTAKGYVDHAGGKEFLIASFLIAAASAWIWQTSGLVLLVATSLFALLFRQYSMTRIGGVTGDVLGACGEISECVFLLGVCLGAGRT